MTRAMAPASCFHFDSSADELPSARGREPVVFEFAAAVLRHLPLGHDQPLSFQSMKGGIERAVLNLQHFITCPLNVLGDFVAVRMPEKKSAKDQHVESAL